MNLFLLSGCADDASSLYSALFKHDSYYGQSRGGAGDVGLYSSPSGSAWKKFHHASMLRGLQKRGAVDDCCYKSCTLSHLRTYCS